MANSDNVTKLGHIDSVMGSIKDYVVEQNLALTTAFQADLSDLAAQLDNVVAGNVFIIGTVSSSVEGAFWLED